MGRPPKTNCEINGKKYFRIRSTIDGIQKPFYGTSETDAKAKRDAYLREVALEREKTKKEKDIATFQKRATEYIQDVLSVSQRYATGTKEKYKTAYTCHIEGTPIDRMRIKNIHPSDIQKFYNGLDVTRPTMENINKFMSGFVKWLVRMGYSDNFLEAVEIPKKPENKRSESIIVWSDEEMHTILDAVRRSQMDFRASFLVLVLIYTGARLSEALSLRYSDFSKDTVSIERQFYLSEIKPPKYNSVRQLPLHPELKRGLGRHKEWHRKEMAKNGYKTDYVFTTSSGNLYDQRNIRTALKRFYNRIGVEYKHPHVYRSTFCSTLCRQGVPIQTASKLMGHKNISVTSKFYAEVDAKSQADAIARLSW